MAISAPIRVPSKSSAPHSAPRISASSCRPVPISSPPSTPPLLRSRPMARWKPSSASGSTSSIRRSKDFGDRGRAAIPQLMTYTLRKPTFLSRVPWWLLAIALLFVLGLWGITGDATYWQIFRALSGGVVTTLWVTAIAFSAATALGLLIALARTSGNRILCELATFYVEIIRGIPVLVFLFYVAFVGAPGLVGAINWLLQPVVAAITVRQFDFVWRAILALTICYSAFIAEIFRAGIESVDRGQIEAARALGFSRWKCFRLITFPQALRNILPPLANDF